jgi:Mycothiol maleylpyruvate isomerase N-terminal domain
MEFRMGDYQASVDTLADELDRVQRVFRGLSGPDWQTPTKLVPVDPDLPRWTVFELAGHFDIAIGLTRTLIDGRGDSQPARDRTSFFINPRSETGPVVYEYAYVMVRDKTPGQMPEVLAGTFKRVIEGARGVPANVVGPGYFAPMRVDEFVASRIVEAVAHGLDLTIALGRGPVASPAGIAATAAILDDLLARRTTGRRPGDLADDLAWILAASGRHAHPDNRLPLIG